MSNVFILIAVFAPYRFGFNDCWDGVAILGDVIPHFTRFLINKNDYSHGVT